MMRKSGKDLARGLCRTLLENKSREFVLLTSTATVLSDIGYLEQMAETVWT